MIHFEHETFNPLVNSWDEHWLFQKPYVPIISKQWVHLKTLLSKFSKMTHLKVLKIKVMKNNCLMMEEVIVNSWNPNP